MRKVTARNSLLDRVVEPHGVSREVVEGPHPKLEGGGDEGVVVEGSPLHPEMSVSPKAPGRLLTPAFGP